MREDRLVFPIMPGVNWRDVRPMEIEPATVDGQQKRLPTATAEPRAARRKTPQPPATVTTVKLTRAQLKRLSMGERVAYFERTRGGTVFTYTPEPATAAPPVDTLVTTKREKPKQPKATIDPKLKRMARELRDQWSERSEDIVAASTGKYDVRRVIAAKAEAGEPTNAIDAVKQMKMIDKAA